MRETNGLLTEELEGLQRRLGRQEKMQEALVDLELEKEVRSKWASRAYGTVLSPLQRTLAMSSCATAGYLKCSYCHSAVVGRIVALKGVRVLIPEPNNVCGKVEFADQLTCSGGGSWVVRWAAWSQGRRKGRLACHC